MPRVKPGERKRAKRPKTRSGCATCKIRRVKCDEAKPFCHRCTSTGRKCDGYPLDSSSPEPACSTVVKRESDANRSLNEKIAECISISSVFGSSREYRSFVFFSERTHDQLAGFYTSDFWSRTILQAAYVDPGIRHAVVALGSIHEAYQNYGDGCLADDFALQQYNLAIHQHVQNLDAASTDPDHVHNYLAACMLFICIEILQAHYVSAWSLIHGAIRILNQIPEDKWQASAWPLSTLGTYLGRLQTQAVGLFGKPGIDSGLGMSADGNSANASAGLLRVRTLLPPIPEQFESIAEARDVFEFYTNKQTHDCEDLFSMVEVKHEGGAEEIVDAWSRAFEALVQAKGHTFDARQRHAASVLRMREAACRSSLDLAQHRKIHGEDEMFWDGYIGKMEEVVDQAEEVVRGSSTQDIVGEKDLWAGTKYRFTLDYGIVGPLFDISVSCRDPRLRRRAVRLLREHSCREGLWDADLAVRAAERFIEAEEAGVVAPRCAADIPSSARILDIVREFVPGRRKAAMYLVRKDVTGPPGSTFRQRLEMEW